MSVVAPVPQPEIDPNTITYALQCTSCGARQVFLEDSTPTENSVTVQEEFIIPSHIVIEQLVPRWCSSCSDSARFQED